MRQTQAAIAVEGPLGIDTDNFCDLPEMVTDSGPFVTRDNRAPAGGRDGCETLICVVPIRFVMTENERITTSSKYVQGVLICRPNATAQWPTIALVAFAVVASGVLVGSLGDERSASAAVALVVGVSAASVAWSAGMIRSEVRADASGLTIRDRWRTRKFAWDEVAGFGVIEQHSPLRWLGNAHAGFTWHVLPRESVPILRLCDGTQRKLLPLTSSTRSEGWSLGDPSAAEIRAALLTRYQATVAAASGSPAR